ncbi:hypothetical protein ACGFIV_04580 [Sphaerisporangium sp. NPDC049003]|uniref:hypothetical protein n=1 Tax=Sphaerisporangium sp. NPDC049003 TaxID=3364517 RepID=UPI00371DF90D
MYKKTLTVAMAAATLATLATLTAAPASAVAFTDAAPKIEVIFGAFTTIREPDSTFTCPAGEVLIDRAHWGDETGWTRYRCGQVRINGETVSVQTRNWTTAGKESNSYFASPPDHVLIGRRHLGDENGLTSYLTGALYWRGVQLRLTSRYWTEPMKESNHSIQAFAPLVMTGRQHKGDENGDTRYEYSTVTVDG